MTIGGTTCRHGWPVNGDKECPQCSQPTTDEKLARELGDVSFTVDAMTGATRHVKDYVDPSRFVPILQRALNQPPGVESVKATEVLVEEIQLLRAKLQPSPCGVDGHRMVDWHYFSQGALSLAPIGAGFAPTCGTGYCRACQRRE